MANLCIMNLEEINFFKTKEKKPVMLENLRNIFYKIVFFFMSFMKNKQTLNHQTTVNELKNTLHKHAKNLIKKRYGKKLTFALRLQQEVLLNRLSAFCQRQVEDIQINGRIDSIDTEVDFVDFKIEGYRVNGRIDRIDYRGDRIELIDYKTSDNPKDPIKSHLVKLSQKAPPLHLPKEAFFEYNGKTFRWVNLQLPLYALATQSTNKDTGSLIIEGGVGIEKNLNVGGAVDVEGDFNIQGALTVGGIGSGNLQVEGAIIAGEFQTGNLGIGTVNDNTINTTTGDLNLNTTGTGRIKLNANTDITGELNVTGDITAFHTSDSRMKHHPVRLERMREAIRKITGYHYTWNELSDKDGQHDIGVLAQEVEGLGLPGITTTRDDGYLAVNYQKLVPVLIQTIKEMDVELSRLSDVVGSVESQSRRFSNLKHIEQMRADIYFIMRWITEKEGELPEYFTSISELEQ